MNPRITKHIHILSIYIYANTINTIYSAAIMHGRRPVPFPCPISCNGRNVGPVIPNYD